jgi:tripartite-type tricarboxylate transporter receptor subunit TctC
MPVPMAITHRAEDRRDRGGREQDRRGRRDVPAKTIPEFTEYARGSKVSLATYGAGSYAHVVAETINKHYGLKIEAVHYRGEGLMWQDVALGAVQGASGSIFSAASVLQTGVGRPIAVPTMVCAKKMADVSTFYEQGLTEKAFHVRGWVGAGAPAGVPDEIVPRLSDLCVEAGKTERIQRSTRPSASTRARARPRLLPQGDRRGGPVWLEVVRGLNLEPQ